jgi:hypothetical protein
LTKNTHTRVFLFRLKPLRDNRWYSVYQAEAEREKGHRSADHPGVPFRATSSFGGSRGFVRKWQH